MRIGQQRTGADQQCIGGLVVVGLDRQIIAGIGINLAAIEMQRRLQAEGYVAFNPGIKRASGSLVELSGPDANKAVIVKGEGSAAAPDALIAGGEFSVLGG